MTVLNGDNTIEDIDELGKIDISSIDVDYIKDISLEDMYAFLGYCDNVRKNSARTKARRVAALKAFFNYLSNKRRLLDYNPAKELETPKIGMRSPIYLKMEEINQLYQGVSDVNCFRDRCLLTVLLNTGVRVSELVSINISDIEDGKVKIVGKGNKERIIYLNAMTMETIDRYINEERKYIKM